MKNEDTDKAIYINNMFGSLFGDTHQHFHSAMPRQAAHEDAEEAEVVVEDEDGRDEDGRDDLPIIFKPAINVEKVVEALNGIISEKGDTTKRQMKSLKDWFVVHKVFSEIDWLEDEFQNHFIDWVEQAFGWPWETRDFKSVLPGFKNAPTFQWGANTVNDRNTGLKYRTLADHIRNTFVEWQGNRIKDRGEFLNLGTDGRPMYIYHPSNR